MAPVISPKKTVEGAIGGVIFDMLAILVACLVFNKVSDATANIWLLVGLTPVLAVAGMFGDLIFSYIKRACGIKDYGKIMPGHGGVLDRFDSVVAVAPLVYLIVAHFPIVA
jgi:phosphatidate cytidylyltransferase